MKKINLPIKYSQWDSRWASTLLGFNTAPNFNIYNYGCLITCLAMVSEYYGQKETPETINTKLKKAGGFVSGGLYVWGAIQNITKFKEVKHSTPAPLTDNQLNQIKDSIDKGYPVMLQIDYNPKTVELDMHYVLCIGYDGNDFIIADPLGGKERPLKDYLGWFRPDVRKAIEQYVIYTGNVPTDNLKDTLITWNDSEGNKHEVGWYVYEWGIEKEKKIELEERLNNLGGIHLQYKKNTDKLLDDMTAELKKAKELVEKATETIQTKDERIAKLKGEKEVLKTRLDVCLSKKDYTLKEILILLRKKIFKR